MVRGQHRCDHTVANLGMALLARQRRLSAECDKTPRGRLCSAEERRRTEHDGEMRGITTAHTEGGEHGHTHPPGPQRHRRLGSDVPAQLECQVEADSGARLLDAELRYPL